MMQTISTFLFQSPIFGQITPPAAVARFGDPEKGLLTFVSYLVRLAIIFAGLFVFINLILAGYQFISGGDPQKINQGWQRIYMSLLGLIIVAASVLLTGVISLIFFGNAWAILSPTIIGPD